MFRPDDDADPDNGVPVCLHSNVLFRPSLIARHD
jgi:hypothetical protein